MSELDNYKRKVKDQDKQIAALTAQVEALSRLVELSNAMVSAAVEAAGTVTETREELFRRVEQRRYAQCLWDEERETYTLRMPEVRQNG